VVGLVFNRKPQAISAFALNKQLQFFIIYTVLKGLFYACTGTTYKQRRKKNHYKQLNIDPNQRYINSNYLVLSKRLQFGVAEIPIQVMYSTMHPIPEATHLHMGFQILPLHN
jgi:hypothetical protein